MNRRNFIGLLSAIPVLSKLIKKPASLPMDHGDAGWSSFYYAEEIDSDHIKPAFGDVMCDLGSNVLYTYCGKSAGWKRLT